MSPHNVNVFGLGFMFAYTCHWIIASELGAALTSTLCGVYFGLRLYQLNRGGE